MQSPPQLPSRLTMADHSTCLSLIGRTHVSALYHRHRGLCLFLQLPAQSLHRTMLSRSQSLGPAHSCLTGW